MDEDSWKRFVPPVRVLKDFGSGWAMVADLLLCLPLSIFVQFTQINYQVSRSLVSGRSGAFLNLRRCVKTRDCRWMIWRNTSTTP